MTTPEKTLVLALVSAVQMLTGGDLQAASDVMTVALVQETDSDVERIKEILPILEEMRDEQKALLNGTAVPTTLAGKPALVSTGFDTVDPANWD